MLSVVAALLVTPTNLAKFDMGESIGLKAFYAAISADSIRRAARCSAGSWWCAGLTARTSRPHTKASR